MVRWGGCVLALLSAFALEGCANTRSVSTKQSSYAGHPKRIYLVVTPLLSDQMGSDFSQQAVARFSEAVAKCDGTVQSHVSSSLELNATAWEAEAQAFKPDVVVAMNFAGGTRDLYGGWMPARIEVRLWQPGATQLAWRAVSSVSAAGLVPVSTRVDSFMKDLIQRMQTDGVFPSCRP